MGKMGALDWITFVLVMIGGLNWGLVGFFQFDLVEAVFGDMTSMSRIIYGLVGLSTVYMLLMSGKMMKKA